MVMGHFRTYKTHLEKAAAGKTVECVSAGRSYGLNLVITFHLTMYNHIYICKIIYKIYTMVHDVYTYCMKCKALHRRHMDDLYDAVYSTYILFSGRWVSN